MLNNDSDCGAGFADVAGKNRPKPEKNQVQQTCLIMFQILWPGVRIWTEQNAKTVLDNVPDCGAGFADLAGKNRLKRCQKTANKIC